MPYGATRPAVFPSTMTNIVRPQHVNVSRISLLQITWRTKSLVAMPTFLNKRVTSPKRPYDIKKTHKCYFGISVSNPCKVTLVSWVCSLSDLLVRILPANRFASSFDTSRMFHVAFDLFASILCCCVVAFQRFLYGLPADTN